MRTNPLTTPAAPQAGTAWPLSRRISVIGKPLVFALCTIPFLIAVARVLGYAGGLGTNPTEALLHYFGLWGLKFIVLTLAVSPLRRLTGRSWIGRFRRMIGLAAFFYVALHFLTYFVLDQTLQFSAVLEDIVERPYITIGMLALTLLIAMAATSTNAMRRRLGRSWQRLHYGVYAVGILGTWHFWWQVKKDISEPLVYAVIVGLLLGERIYRRARPANVNSH